MAPDIADMREFWLRSEISDKQQSRCQSEITGKGRPWLTMSRYE